MRPITRRGALALLGLQAAMLPGIGPILAAPAHNAEPWWKRAIVYQIYPRSFMDSNGDGIGDLRGITSRLDHCRDLGIDTIWLGPVFASPNVDNGYDISDYRSIMPEFGTMADFDAMLAAMQARGIRLIMDLVVNHTSDQHFWFQQSRLSRSNPYRDYYIWRDGKDGGPPNNYPSFFGGSAWQHDDATGQYYLHYFAKGQPDLNWDNPSVRHDVYDLMRFWLAKGVSGFRMDVIPFISKQTGLPSLPPDALHHPQDSYANGPHVHDYLQEMNRAVLSPQIMTVGEAFGVNFAQAPLYTDARRHELDMIFHFDIVRLGRDGWRLGPWTVPALKALYTKIDNTAGAHGWGTSFLCNHDNPRTASRFGDGSPQSAKALAALVLTQRATPFLYQGEEIGMTNYPFAGIDDFNDPEAHGQWRDHVETGEVPADLFLRNLRQTSRDNARTPMQWNGGANAGFTTGTPWLPVNPNHSTINVEAETADPQSVLHFVQAMIRLRKANPVLVDGAFADLAPDHPALFAYTRTGPHGAYLVLINLTAQPATFDLPLGIQVARCLIDTHPASSDSCYCPPWRAAVFELASQ